MEKWPDKVNYRYFDFKARNF